jgi:exodeoxyribonuclease VII small subunit
MADETPRGYEDLLKELTQVVERLEKGNLPLEESIALYAKGVELQKAAQAVLDSAQARLEVLVAQADGTRVPKALDADAFLDER